MSEEDLEPTKPSRKSKKAKQVQIPGTERTDVHKDIERAASKYVEARDARMSMTKVEVETQAKLLAVMKEHKLTTYRCDSEDLEVEVVPESEKAKVRRVAPPGEEE